MPARALNSIPTVVAATGFVAIGIAVFINLGKPTFEKSQASESWPTVSGVVKSSRVDKTTTRNRRQDENDIQP